jgi:hypothetical protein
MVTTGRFRRDWPKSPKLKLLGAASMRPRPKMPASYTQKPIANGLVLIASFASRQSWVCKTGFAKAEMRGYNKKRRLNYDE